jgi:flavorubredoxin
LGETKLTFIEAPMLHWPDSMFCYLSGENILFPNDAFGQHYASESLFNDKVNITELYNEAIKYYTNILTPFSPLVTRKIKEVLSFDLPVNMICPSHGIIWRDNPAQIVEAYLKWADAYSENRISIVYDTMWDSTLRMAEAIADGIKSKDDKVTVKLFNAAKEDKNDVLTEIFRSHTVLFGSPTINGGFTYAIAGILEMAKGLKLKGKRAAAFGSYGWSGEAVKQITEHLKACGFEIINDGFKTLWVPDSDVLKQCFEFGKNL